MILNYIQLHIDIWPIFSIFHVVYSKNEKELSKMISSRRFSTLEIGYLLPSIVFENHIPPLNFSLASLVGGGPGVFTEILRENFQRWNFLYNYFEVFWAICKHFYSLKRFSFQVLGILKSVFWLNPGTEFGDGVYETKFS